MGFFKSLIKNKFLASFWENRAKCLCINCHPSTRDPLNIIKYDMSSLFSVFALHKLISMHRLILFDMH